MPVSPSRQVDVQPDRLRPYAFHGVRLAVRGGHGVGDCPFCGREGKFSVACDTGLWRCFVCGSGTANGGGNALVFLRLLHERCVAATGTLGLRDIARDRRLLDPGTVSAWGVCVDPGRTWLIPGYGTDGKLDQLYRRVRWSDGTWRLLPTPGVWPEGKVHALHLSEPDFNPATLQVWVMEGPWDGMAMWEVANHNDVCIVAVPGCNVWRDEWSELCRGKDVTLWFDSDHPIPEALARDKTIRPGLDGMCRVAKRLSGIAASVRFVRWGREGYDESRPSGWDVRDHLTATGFRAAALEELLAKVEPAPADWFTPHHLKGAAPSSNGQPGSAPVESEYCDSWEACEAVWVDALEWRRELGDVMTTMLAVVASTNQAGDNQLCLDVVGDAGSAKTRLCKGLLVSKHCKIVLHLKSFHSGFKKPGEGDADCSFVSRINGFCLVTPEADALSIGMSWEQLNSQMRQIFDGETANTYGNSDQDRQYKGLRCPWIRAGTPALMDKDNSRLGDRFLRIRIEEPAQETKRAIMLRSLRNERQAVVETSNGTEASIIPPKMRRAYALTGGFVDWLRAHVEERIATVDMDTAAEQRCCDLAELVADMRARPNVDPKKQEVHHTKELGSRLASQFGRLALCLAVVLGRRSTDAGVLRVVRKVATDTAHGHTLDIARWMCAPNPKGGGRTYQECGGLTVDTLAMWSGMTPERLANYMAFLRAVGVTEFRPVKQTRGSWTLTQRVYDLYTRIMWS